MAKTKAKTKKSKNKVVKKAKAKKLPKKVVEEFNELDELSAQEEQFVESSMDDLDPEEEFDDTDYDSADED